MGKTQLVLEFLFRVREKYGNCLVMWISVTSAEALHQGYVKIAQQFNIPGCDNEKNDIKQLVREYLNKYDFGRWLLVFDNADNLHMWIGKPKSQKLGNNEQRLIDYLPTNNQGCVIFTTRDKKTASRLAKIIIDVPEMDENTQQRLSLRNV